MTTNKDPGNEKAPESANSEARISSPDARSLIDVASGCNINVPASVGVAGSVTVPDSAPRTVSGAVRRELMKLESLFDEAQRPERLSAQFLRCEDFPPGVYSVTFPLTIIELPCYYGSGFVRRLIAWDGGDRARTFAAIRRLHLLRLLPPNATQILSDPTGLGILLDAGPEERDEWAAALAQVEWAVGFIKVLDGSEQIHRQTDAALDLGHQEGSVQ